MLNKLSSISGVNHNEYSIHPDNNKVTIILVKSPKYGLRESWIDTKYVELFKQYHWCICKDCNTFYLCNSSKYKTKLLKGHHLVLPMKDDLMVDHIDRNGLNNLESNLRYVTNQQNQENSINTRWFEAISPEGEIHTFNNLRKFIKEHDMWRANVNKCLTGRYKTHKGWRFRRINEVE